jgi:hypothetical protein
VGARARLTVSEPQVPEQTSQSAPDATGGVSRGSDAKGGPVAEFHEPEEQRVAIKREDIRAWLAGGLTVLFIAMIIAMFLSAVFGGEQWSRVQEFAQITFGTVAGLMGSAMRFYFGSQR